MTISVVVWHVVRLIGPALMNFGKTLATVFVKVWGFFQQFYTTVLRPFITWAWSQVQRLHSWLVKTFGPIIKHLRQLREWILRTYDKWLRPVFATLDALRAIFRTLEIFHVPFADAIDRKIADLESRLLAPLRFALVKINEVIGWIDRIVTFDGLLQRATLIESQWRYVGDTWAALLKHRPADVSQAENDALHRLNVPPEDPKRLAGALTDYYRAGAGELEPAITELAAVWQLSAVQ